MPPESAQPTGIAHAPLASEQAATSQGVRRQNQGRTGRTRFQVEGGSPACLSRTPVLVLPDAPFGAQRRIDPAAIAYKKIARLGHATDQSPNSVRFDPAVREYSACRLAENPASRRERSSR